MLAMRKKYLEKGSYIIWPHMTWEAVRGCKHQKRPHFTVIFWGTGSHKQLHIMDFFFYQRFNSGETLSECKEPLQGNV